MAELVHDCPRCGTKKITFDVGIISPYKVEYGWQHWYDAFCVCKRCSRAVIFLLSEKGIDEGERLRDNGLSKLPTAMNNYVTVEGYVSLADFVSENPPKYLPEVIDRVFREGAKCHVVGCYNAAAAMFRLCLDLATKELLPAGDAENSPPKSVRFSLGHRLPWLFDHSILPEGLRELSKCVKEDGNDGAHDGNLGKEDSEDLQDFAFLLLERHYTEPERLRLAAERRESRRNPPSPE